MQGPGVYIGNSGTYFHGCYAYRLFETAYVEILQPPDKERRIRQADMGGGDYRIAVALFFGDGRIFLRCQKSEAAE